MLSPATDERGYKEKTAGLKDVNMLACKEVIRGPMGMVDKSTRVTVHVESDWSTHQ